MMVMLPSTEALFCNQNYTLTDRGRLQAKALLVPTTTSALKTSCHLLYTQHRLRSSLIIYLFVYSFDGLSSKAEHLIFVVKAVCVEFSLRKHPNFCQLQISYDGRNGPLHSPRCNSKRKGKNKTMTIVLISD